MKTIQTAVLAILLVLSFNASAITITCGNASKTEAVEIQFQRDTNKGYVTRHTFPDSQITTYKITSINYYRCPGCFRFNVALSEDEPSTLSFGTRKTFVSPNDGSYNSDFVGAWSQQNNGAVEIGEEFQCQYSENDSRRPGMTGSN
jgi:hypothetical protein